MSDNRRGILQAIDSYIKVSADPIHVAWIGMAQLDDDEVFREELDGWIRFERRVAFSSDLVRRCWRYLFLEKLQMMPPFIRMVGRGHQHTPLIVEDELIDPN